MNILIIYPYYNHQSLMRNFSSKLGNSGIFADVICVSNYCYEKTTNLPWPTFLVKCFKFVNAAKDSWVRKVVRKLVYKNLISKLFPMYDIVDFHAYLPSYNELMRECVKKKVKFDITPWGSDLMRATKEKKQLVQYGFDHCYRLKLTDNLYDVMGESYGNTYDDKSRIVYFGNSDLPVIDDLTESEAKAIKYRLYGDTENKKIVVCGYNGIPSQNHFKMLEALSLLNETEKRSVHVVFPMTYGAPQGYMDRIRAKMEDLTVPYTIMDKFLEPKEVASIRRTADIVINVQNTDAMSGSLQDHLYCGNVCIFGEWLNYSPYTNNGIYYIKTRMEDIASHLKDALLHYPEYHSLCLGNHDKIKSLFSWEATIAKQVSVYGE